MTLIQSLLGFILCAGIIVFAGTRLARHGDRIAELTGIGKAWMGLILMSAVTSLPELFTGISAVAIVKAPNLAAGDVFGSCVFNLLILSMLDAMYKKPIAAVVRPTHVFAGACAIVLIAISGASILLADHIPTLGWISAMTPILVLSYIFSVWLIFKFESKAPADPIVKHVTQGKIHSLRNALMLYGMYAMIVVGAALFLPYFGNQIAAMTGMGNTFFGTLFLAASTSLPELVVSVAALRMGSIDMAVGNLFGSNIFNMVILAVDDVFYREGSLFSSIEQSHLLSILAVIAMTAVAIIGLLFKAERKRFLLGVDTFIILLLYVALMVVLYQTS